MQNPTTQSNLETKTEAEFQYASAPQATRNSSLYYFIEMLRLKQTASALDIFNVKLLAKVSENELLPTPTYIRNAYIIEFPALDAQNQLGGVILKDAHFLERHLSIDKFFAPNSTLAQHAFPYCHYTENYETSEGKRVVLHLYINSEGKVTHCQIKSIQTTIADDKPLKMVEYYSEDLVNQLKPMVMKNAEIALQLIKKINLQKTNTFLSLHKEVNALDHELSRLSLYLYKKAVQGQYLQLGQKFINNIAQLNALTDSRYADRRDYIIQQICQRIHAGEFNPKFFESVSQTIETTQTEIEDPSAEENNLATAPQNLKDAHNKSKLTTDIQRSELLAIIKKHKEQLESLPKEELLTTNELIKRVQILNNLRDSLLALYCLPNNPKNELQFIETLEKELEKIPSLIQTFEALAKLGKVTEISELYPHIENNLNTSFLRELIDDALYYPDSNKIAVCDYFYANSALYRTVLEVLLSTFEIRMNLGVSLLITAFYGNNKLMFEMLLRQGANPNDAGSIQGNFILSTLYTIFASYKNDLFYVEQLLHYGALLDLSNDTFSDPHPLSSVNTTLQPHPKYASVIQETLKQIQLRTHVDQKSNDEFFRILTKRTSGLLVACTLEPNNNLISFLAPKSSLYGLLCSVAYLTCTRIEIKTRFLESCNQAGLRFFDNQTQCDQHTMSLTLPKGNKMTPMFLFCISEKTTKSKQLNKIMKSLVDNLNNKYKETLTNDAKQLKALTTKLMHQAKEETDHDDKKMLYKACLYLQICNPNPTITDTETILQICAYIAKNCLDTGKEIEWRSAYIHCMCGINIVNKTMPAAAKILKNTPIFKYLEKLLDKTNEKLKTPPCHVMLLQLGANLNQASITSTPVIIPPQKAKGMSIK